MRPPRDKVEHLGWKPRDLPDRELERMIKHAKFCDEPLPEALEQALEDENEFVRSAAANALRVNETLREQGGGGES